MDFKQYIGKQIIAWLWYNPNFESAYGDINKVCYVYPRIFAKNGSYDIIDSKNDFPQLGRIEMRIQGGEGAEDVYCSVGSLVIIKINTNAAPNYNGNNMYSLKYNSQFGRGNSEIWIEKFNGKDFYQVIDIDLDINAFQDNHQIEAPSGEVYTNYILLRNSAKLYGPFGYDIKKSTEYLSTMDLYGLPEFQYVIGEYNAIDYNDAICIIEDQNDEEAVTLLPRKMVDDPTKCVTAYDWISSEKLVDGFVDALKVGNTYTRDQLRQIKDSVIQLIKTNSSLQLTEERSTRIQRLVRGLSEDDARIKDIIQFVLQDEALKSTLANEIAENYFETVKDKVEGYAVIQSHIDELKKEELQLQQRVDELKNDEQAATAQSVATDRHEIEELTAELEAARKESAELKSLAETQKSIEELCAERDRYAADRNKEREKYNQQIIDNNELNRQFLETLDRFKDKASQTARVLDSKLLDKILRGVDGEIDDNKKPPFDAKMLNAPMSQDEIIARVSDFIRDIAKRDITENDVTNYLICISQGFITTFAGEPGTGKTSLCNILAKSFGLAVDGTQSRFVDISVERGWTSHKDFIGYYNPLTKTMEKSNADVFYALKLLDDEHGNADPDQIAPFIILLDEANLSPIEHYWAAFLKNCDIGSSKNRSISLGGNENWMLPEYLRFLATVNFDHTTEELSPRFLDRSWIITLEPTRIDYESDEIPENLGTMIPFTSLQEAFLPTPSDKIDEPVESKWNTIQTTFKRCSLPIMPRNLKMVRNYCAVACRCMSRETPSTKLAPLDYAISQKILPTINGSGDIYEDLIAELMKECTEQNMPLCAKHLKRMQRVAEKNMGFYQFFAR